VGRLPTLSSREVITILNRLGLEEVRQGRLESVSCSAERSNMHLLLQGKLRGRVYNRAAR
jgi:hypothetical protein